MIRKLLIANRGEIACRVIKTARAMGIRTVAVYSDADSQALHVQMADEAVHLGPSPAKESYLLGSRIVELATALNVDAIHPGYGFLSENAAFAKQCAEHDIIFVGPPVSAIEAMGSKSAAKAIMEQANVPLVPGYHGDDQAPEVIKQHADAMGYPVLLKAAAGGGGKGMRQVWSEAEFTPALEAAKREAMSSFGDDHMLVEKYLTQPRHVELQVFCDQHGNGVYLFERDCSVQRRHQKVIEEAPAPGMTPELRAQMGEAAIKAAKAIDYEGAGTVEFLLDVDGSFYFMEMNTRLQVEHPVTEMITGQDLVQWQLQVADGEPLPLAQEELRIHGHAFEARIYAEDPDNEFLPDTGTLNYLQPPTEDGHVRVDTGVLEGDTVSVYYDPMIAKLITWDHNRDKALARLAKALQEYRIKGLVSNVPFLYNIATSAPFRNAELDTGFIGKHQDSLFAKQDHQLEKYLPLMSATLLLQQHLDSLDAISEHNADIYSPWARTNSWRANEVSHKMIVVDFQGEHHVTHITPLENAHANAHVNPQVSPHMHTNSGLHMQITCGERVHRVVLELSASHRYAREDSERALLFTVDGHRISANLADDDDNLSLFLNDIALHFSEAKPDLGLNDDTQHGSGFTAPMNGTVVKCLVEPGAPVKQNDAVLIMEAMKMEHTLTAPSDGKVTEFYFKEGELVDGGAELLAFAADPDGV